MKIDVRLLLAVAVAAIYGYVDAVLLDPHRPDPVRAALTAGGIAAVIIGLIHIVRAAREKEPPSP